MADDLRQAALRALDDLVSEAKEAGSSDAWLNRRRDAILAALAQPAAKRLAQPAGRSNPVKDDLPPQWLPPSKFDEWERLQKTVADIAAQAAGRDRAIRLDEVLRITGLGKSNWRDMVARGEAPKGFHLSARCIGWSERAVYDFVKARQQAQASGPIDGGEEGTAK